MALEITKCPTDVVQTESLKCHRNNLKRLTRNTINALFDAGKLPEGKIRTEGKTGIPSYKNNYISDFNQFINKYGNKKNRENLYINQEKGVINRDETKIWENLMININNLLIINRNSVDNYFINNEIRLKKVDLIIPILLLFFIVEDIYKVNPNDNFFHELLNFTKKMDKNMKDMNGIDLLNYLKSSLENNASKFTDTNDLKTIADCIEIIDYIINSGEENKFMAVPSNEEIEGNYFGHRLGGIPSDQPDFNYDDLGENEEDEEDEDYENTFGFNVGGNRKHFRRGTSSKSRKTLGRKHFSKKCRKTFGRKHFSKKSRKTLRRKGKKTLRRK